MQKPSPQGLSLLYRLYQRRLRKQINMRQLPRHIAVIVDGNRRWAKQRLQECAGIGHRAGAKKIPEFLHWCETLGIETVTLYLLSIDNLSGRASAELEELFSIIASLSGDLAADGFRVKHVGQREMLPPGLGEALSVAERASARNTRTRVNLAVGYGGRMEIVEAVRALAQSHRLAGGDLESFEKCLSADSLAKHLWTGGQPDPDLVIRTSGEQRLSDFMIWQSAHSEFYVMETLYPELREVELLRAVRDFSRRSRRFGT